jgi:hypothetical protein
MGRVLRTYVVDSGADGPVGVDAVYLEGVVVGAGEEVPGS